MTMRVFVAGGTGVIGRRLVPLLVARGHQVTATTTSPARTALLTDLGAEPVVLDGLDPMAVGEAVAAARPDAIVHQMTAIGRAKPDLKHIDRWFAVTNRLRTEGTDHLLAAAEAEGVAHVVAQSYGTWNGIREGGWVKTEQDPLDPETGTAARAGAEAINHLEEAVLAFGGAALRYGGLYGPGATDDQVELVRKRQFPWSAAEPAIAPGCTSTTRPRPPHWPWNCGRRVCSTSSTTNPRRSANGCRTWPRARARNRRCGCPGGWPDCSPETSP